MGHDNIHNFCRWISCSSPEKRSSTSISITFITHQFLFDGPNVSTLFSTNPENIFYILTFSYEPLIYLIRNDCRRYCCFYESKQDTNETISSRTGPFQIYHTFDIFWVCTAPHEHHRSFCIQTLPFSKHLLS